MTTKALTALCSYSSSGEDSDENIDQQISLPLMNPAPAVDTKMEVLAKTQKIIDSDCREITFNPTYEQLYRADVGPTNPFKTKQEAFKGNSVCGLVENAHVSNFQFENQRRTFHSYGFALDPSIESSGNYIVSEHLEEFNNEKTVFESTVKRPGDKRKREKANDPSDVDGYLGPWAKYVDEELISKPSETDQKKFDEYKAKSKPAAAPTEDSTPMQEKSILHIPDPLDYQGRSFLRAPKDIDGVNLYSEDPPSKCFMPKNLLHVWSGHTKGLCTIKWFPKTAHLLLSCALDGRVKLWEVYHERRCVRTYVGHKKGVKDICFSNDGSKFLSASYDRTIKLWDTETGECISRFSNNKIPFCVKFNPDEDKQHLFITGMDDKKVHCYDVNTGEIIQEYDRHLGTVNTITFIDENRRFVTTSDDKSMRVWEWDIPVDWKYIADPSMHSMPRMALSPSGKWLAGQSMDNQIKIFNAPAKCRENRKKIFKGHMVAGYSCGIDFSPDNSYIMSGDADGNVNIWDWKTRRIFSKWKAHEKVCMDVLWHPHEQSKMVSAGWDGVIKFWD